ncbi:MAG: NADH-quinone oxidoreductase subunit J [Pseudomonadota bacterium]|nr:NADH-quinone oxidoreductase subunit J [Pseudomonadota bacterium]
MLFVTVAVLMLFLAHQVVFSLHPLRAVVSLVGCFVAMSILWIDLGAEFLGLALIFVYVGAVMALFLFMVMMLNIDCYPHYSSFTSVMGWISLGLGVLVPFVWWFVSFLSGDHEKHVFNHDAYGAQWSNTHALGSVLYTDYLVPFQLLGVVLLVAILISVGWVFRGIRQRRRQVIVEQIQVDPKGRVVMMDGPCKLEHSE